LGAYVDKLTEIRPALIIGYPSSLHALATYCTRHGITTVRPRLVITTAETLLDLQRQVIEEAFGCRVADQYGSTEMVHFVSQCEAGGYHVHPEHGIVEIVDATGRRAPPGVRGEVVCTGLVNRSMPLIRYRLGDQATLADGRCPCGRAFPLLREIHGRNEDVVFTADGRPLGRLDPVFKGAEGIEETQIVQSDVDSLDIYVVASDRFTAIEQSKLAEQLRSRIGDGTALKFHRVPSIAREGNGKFRAVVSRVGARNVVTR
jgi:phenylacetate-CoA ligase